MVAANSKGFEIVIDIRWHILRTQAWGFWDVEFAKKYKHALTEKIEEIGASGKEWYAIVDFTRFYPRLEEVQNLIREYIETARKQGMKKIVYLGERAVTELRLNRLFQESDRLMYTFVESETEAIQWLLSE